MTDPLFFTAANADLPSLALSVRQPWAHAIIYLSKDIENRDWSGFNPGMRVRGRVAVHASAGMAHTLLLQAAHCTPDDGSTRYLLACAREHLDEVRT